MRTIDELSPHEQAKIAANLYIAMTEDDLAQAGCLARSVTVTVRDLFAAYAAIWVVNISIFFAMASALNYGTYFVALGAIPLIAVCSAVAHFWLLLFVAWFGRLVDANNQRRSK